MSNPHNRPWQFDWKRPRWSPVQDDTTAQQQIAGGCLVDHAAALVRSDEVEENFRSDDSESSLVLTVSLLSSRENEPKVADIVRLQLIQQSNSASDDWVNEQEGPEMSVLQRRTLRWPESALQDNIEQDRNPFLLPFMKFRSKRATNGLVAASLCRLPPENPTSALADAFDVVHLMSLGMATGLSVGQKEWLHRLTVEQQQASTTTSSTRSSTDLVLACLSNDGMVHYYSPWELLAASKVEDASMDQGMESLLLGDMLSTMKESILPLSKPMATSTLSVPMKKRNQSQWEESTKEETEAEIEADEEATPTKKVSIWDASLWDPTIDRATLAFQTRNNRPTLTVAALEYLCVAGRGRRVRRRVQSHMNLTTMAEDWNDGASQGTHGARERTRSAVSIASTVTADHDGGFVTFLSLRNYSEVRTVYLPFPPIRISPFVWGGLSFLLVVGEVNAVAIRIDSSDVSSVIAGEAPSLFADISEHDTNERDPIKKKTEIAVRRFQLLPILLPDTHHSLPLIFGSSTTTAPPSLVFVLTDEETNHISVAQRTLSSVDETPDDEEDPSLQTYQVSDKLAVIRTDHAMGHAARIKLRDGTTLSQIRCHSGQGWCLIGAESQAFFICWEGATAAQGAFVCELTEGGFDFADGLISTILPVDPFTTGGEKILGDVQLPFTGPYEKPDALRRDSSLLREKVIVGDGEEELDEIVVEALESISSLNYRETVLDQSPPLSARRRSTTFTHREKSVRLLRQCSSWMHLDQSSEDGSQFDLQDPVLSVHLAGRSCSHFTSSLRRAVVENGVATPFQQVLAWLSEGGDYFTAASLALDLLRDAESLRHLWKAFEKIDEEEEQSRLEGLLDGITPIYVGQEDKAPLESTLTQLSDMTVGCLTKGGYAMSSTLEHFVGRDLNYDPARACLMLVATAACTLSDDEDTVLSAMGKEYKKEDGHSDRILWPVRCLLKIGVARDYLVTALLLLNMTIPDELRRRRRSCVATESLPSMQMCKSLVSLIVASSPDSVDLLLGLVDEQSRVPYWESLQHETQLELAIIEIDGKYPLLRHVEVRSWILEQLHRSMKLEGSAAGVNVFDIMPTPWLQKLSMACLTNSRCSFEGLIETPEFQEESGGLETYGRKLRGVRQALVAEAGSGGLDFNLIIPALLILEHRHSSWHDKSAIPTQSILNATCYLAGRRNADEPAFALDSSVLMRQCALAGNVEAGANVVGGKNGLVLECCHILIEEVGLDMEQAEAFLGSEKMKLDSDVASEEDRSFAIRDGHCHVLWLLEEHILSIRTFGEFETIHLRGKVDPVFAARTCLRTWWALTRRDLKVATAWLVKWLSRQLAMDKESTSPHRLACAALIRALVWPSSSSGTEDTALAASLAIPSHFLVQLAQSCCGLAEAIPPYVAEQMKDAPQDADGSFSAFGAAPTSPWS